jgi:hypothetical protein
MYRNGNVLWQIDVLTVLANLVELDACCSGGTYSGDIFSSIPLICPRELISASGFDNSNGMDYEAEIPV